MALANKKRASRSLPAVPEQPGSERARRVDSLPSTSSKAANRPDSTTFRQPHEIAHGHRSPQDTRVPSNRRSSRHGERIASEKDRGSAQDSEGSQSSDSSDKIALLRDWIDAHHFENPTKEESFFLDHPSFTSNELEFAMQLARSRAEFEVEENKSLFESTKNKTQFVNERSLESFIDKKNGDSNESYVIPLNCLFKELDAGNSQLHKDPRFKCTVVVLAKIAQEATRENALLQAELERLEPVFAWVEDACRIKKSSDPAFLNKKNLPSWVLKRAVLHAMEIAFDYMATYTDHMNLIHYSYSRNRKLMGLAEDFPEGAISECRIPVMDLWKLNGIKEFDFWKMNDREIREIDLADDGVRARFKIQLTMLCRSIHEIGVKRDMLGEAIKKYEAKIFGVP